MGHTILKNYSLFISNSNVFFLAKTGVKKFPAYTITLDEVFAGRKARTGERN